MARSRKKKYKERSPFRKKIEKLFWNLTFVIALMTFLVSAFSLIRIYLNYQAGEKEYAQIQNMAVVMRDQNSTAWAGEEDSEEEFILPSGYEHIGPMSPADEPAAEPSEYAGPPIDTRELVPPPLTVDFSVLQELNPDVRGWIYIEALDISYPIVQGTENHTYLHRTYEGAENPAGSIFMDSANAGDFSDGNTIIYGHNMKDQTMFGKLKLLDTQQRYQDSIYFWVMTPEKNMRCQIISAFYAEDASEVYTLFSMCGEEFVSYIHTCLNMNILPLEQPRPEEIGRLITLSTCAAANSTQRFVVQGRVIQESKRTA